MHKLLIHYELWWIKKVLSLAISEGLLTTSHSLALSHYWPTWELLAAGFPPWPISPLLSQPDPLRLPGGVHVDASLSADAGSTWTSDHQTSPLQAIQQNLPPSSWITRACQCSRQCFRARNSQQENIWNSFLFHRRKQFSFPQLQQVNLFFMMDINVISLD